MEQRPRRALRVVRTGSTTVLLVAALALAGCFGSRSASHPTTKQVSSARSRFVFVSAGSALQEKCRSTARSLSYPVPCLSQVPNVMNVYARVAFIGRGSDGWRRWVFGSTNVGDEHLVVTASPRPLQNYAKVVNGPAWFPGERVRPIAWVTIKGWRMRAVFVPPETNDGSAFMHHVVLIWTVGQHTYGIGFHNIHGLRETLLLDEQLARHITLVGP